MSKPSVLVTGASGHLGRRIVELLLERDAGPIIATTRNPASLADLAAKGVDVRRADFDDEASLAGAFAGAGRAVLVSTDALDRPGRRLDQHRAAVRAFERAGVKHLVYTSLPNPVGSLALIAGDHAGTEAALEASSLEFTVLRNNLYADLLLLSLPHAVASGKLVDARDGGAIAWVTRDDCARVAAGAVLRGEGRRTYDVTGPESLTSEALASLASEVSGKPVTHVPVPIHALIEGFVAHGMPKPMAEVYASFDAATAHGDFAKVVDTSHLSGRAPTTVKAFLTANRAALTSGA